MVLMFKMLDKFWNYVHSNKTSVLATFVYVMQ